MHNAQCTIHNAQCTIESWVLLMYCAASAAFNSEAAEPASAASGKTSEHSERQNYLITHLAILAEPRLPLTMRLKSHGMTLR